MAKQLTELSLSVRAANAVANVFPLSVEEAVSADLRAHLDVQSNHLYRDRMDAIVAEVRAACVAELAELQGLN